MDSTALRADSNAEPSACPVHHEGTEAVSLALAMGSGRQDHDNECNKASPDDSADQPTSRRSINITRIDHPGLAGEYGLGPCSWCSHAADAPFGPADPGSRRFRTLSNRDGIVGREVLIGRA